MERKDVITAPQLFSFLLLCNIITGITYNLQIAKSTSMWDHILSAVFAFFINTLFIFPIYKLRKINPAMNIADHCAVSFERLGKIFLTIYGIYYLFACCYVLSLFNIFVRDIINPEISLFLLTLCVVLAASYAACKGIEGLARACSIILFLICLAIIFILLALFPQIEPLNFSPLLYNGVTDTFNGTLYLMSLSFFLPLAAVLAPFSKGNIKKALIATNSCVYILFIFSIFVVVGALGDYLQTQSFPLYTATSVAEIGVFRRLDAIYLGIFTAGLFIMVAIFLFAFFLVMKKLFGSKHSKKIIFGGDVFLLIFSLMVPIFRDVAKFFFDINFIVVFTVLTAFVIPVIILIRHKMQLRKGEEG